MPPPRSPSTPPRPAAVVDPRSGYCAATKTFHSLRTPPASPPPDDRPLSFPAAAFSLLPTQHLPSHPALIDSTTGETLPFPTFLSRVHALAAALRGELSVSPGDVIFILAPAGIHIPVLYYAAMSIGAVVSPANPALTAGEVAKLVSLSNPSMSFTVQAAVGMLPPGLTTVLLDSPTFLSFLSQQELLPHHHEDEDAAGVMIHQSDPAAILYSSGTTGSAKAVVITHRNLIAMASSAAAPGTEAAADVLLLTVPMFHVYGFVFCLRTVVVAQQTLVLHTARRFNAMDVLGAVGRFRVTRLALAPPALLGIVQAAEADDSVAAAHTAAMTLQAVTCGGASVAPELTRRFSRKFPNVCLFQVGFSLTQVYFLMCSLLKHGVFLFINYYFYEATTGFCRLIEMEETKRIGSVGRLLWGAEAKIVRPETGDALPPGMPGELWVRGPFVMKGYLGEKDATEAILDREGWLRTGDLCCIDEDGFIYVLDRLKELIKYKGYQVAPAELESLLQTHPDIDEAAVVPYISIVEAIYRCSIALGLIVIICQSVVQVVYYKRIHHVFLVDSIPKNAAGKILRKDLVKMLRHISSKL
ncbi:hypothetical protein HU200_030976 [Digitaria exilis]|uniref:4-coumarate--CoA ligase n=1 Tax=Digitaria exilis TaxID=1010633 RepID=A0A835BQP3_9POAL|nr:hypothetical protein HU200_030976 [Digitaria exilis]